MRDQMDPHGTRGIGTISTLALLAALAAPAWSDRTVIHAGRVLDVVSGQYRDDVLVEIEAGQIQSITEAAGKPPEQAWIDLSNLTVLPGLIDVHTHLCDNSFLGADFDPWALPAASFGIAGATNARTVLEAGFTTVRNVSEPYFAGVALRDAIANGWIRGPRIYASGPMITMTGGHGDWGGWMAAEHQFVTPAEAVADGVVEVRKTVRSHIAQGVDWIKLSATGGFYTSGSIPGATTYSIEEIRAAVEEASKRGFGVAAHAHGDQGIRNAVLAGVRSIEHGGLIEDASFPLLVDHAVVLVMDLLAAHYDLIETAKNYSDKELPAEGAALFRDYTGRFQRAVDAGVTIAFGTDSGVYPHGRNAEQFELMVKAGMTPLQAIQSATVTAASLLQIDSRAGQIAPGMWADLIGVEGDPLVDVSVLEKVQVVIKNGEIIKHSSRRPTDPALAAPPLARDTPLGHDSRVEDSLELVDR